MKTFARVLGLAVAGLIVVAILLVVCALAYVSSATHAGVAAVNGKLAGLSLDGPVTIARDARGVAHVRARTDHDVFFAEGYAMASDRLFQMDLTRRYTQGRLAEILGSPLVKTDEQMRSYGIERLALAQYARVPQSERRVLDAFAAGVNAAAAREPLPPEYRVLFASFREWQPQDAIAVGYATALDLDDDASAIIARDWIHRRFGMAGTDFFLPLTDPKYDVPTDGARPGPIPSLPPAPAGMSLVSGGGPRGTLAADGAMRGAALDDRAPVGSNCWAAGANRTSVHRAILANDPHLSLSVPGVWWLFEGRSPTLHIAGAVLAGTPGVTLGHNEHVAWGVTAGETSAMRLIHERVRADEFSEHGRWVRAVHRREIIDVRFGAPVTIDIETTPNGTVIGRDGDFAYVRDWIATRVNEDIFGPYLGLGRSRSVDEALAAMRGSDEPALNLVAADDSGRATYHLVGNVPADAAWGRWALDGDAAAAQAVSFVAVPHVDPSRDALVVTSNNRSNGGADALRLAPFWPSPYRAFTITNALAGTSGARASVGGYPHEPATPVTPEAVGDPQFANESPAERELARLVLAAARRQHLENDPALLPAIEALRGFDGMMSADSIGAAVVGALRPALYARLTASLPPDVAQSYIRASTSLTVPLRALRERPRGWVPDWDRFAVDALRDAVARLGSPLPRFGTWAAQPLTHPLAAFGLNAWNGPTMTGRGGAYAPAVQNNGHGQSFRALWIAGDWDAGTIDIDAGESGEPGSPHYTDQTAGWQRFERTALPFSDAAVVAATKSTLTLVP